MPIYSYWNCCVYGSGKRCKNKNWVLSKIKSYSKCVFKILVDCDMPHIEVTSSISVHKSSIEEVNFSFLIFNTNSLMDRYYHTFSFVSFKMVSNTCPIIGQQVVIIFPTQKVTIVTL